MASYALPALSKLVISVCSEFVNVEISQIVDILLYKGLYAFSEFFVSFHFAFPLFAQVDLVRRHSCLVENSDIFVDYAAADFIFAGRC